MQPQKNSIMIEIYTDGGCRKNPGIGACVFVQAIDGVAMYSERRSYQYTTNNAMELSAIYHALVFARNISEETTIYSDSAYAVNCVNVWYRQWKQQNTLLAKKNIEVIEAIINLMKPNFTLRWVKGHASNPFNNLADRLVNQAMDEITLQLYQPLSAAPLPPFS